MLYTNFLTLNLLPFNELYFCHVLKNDLYRNENDFEYYYYDSADYKRQKFGLNINYGVVVNIFKKVGVVPKIGLGVKHRNVAFSNVVNSTRNDPNDNMERYFVLNNSDFREIEGAVTKFNLDFKVNFFYKF